MSTWWSLGKPEFPTHVTSDSFSLTIGVHISKSSGRAKIRKNITSDGDCDDHDDNDDDIEEEVVWRRKN